MPLEGAIVDVWHCDALGVYSGVRAARHRLPARLPADRRGWRRDVHDRLPGLVPGPRGPHPLQDPARTRTRGRLEFTSQLFFDDALSAQVYASGVYASKGTPDRSNANDSIFNESGGATLLAVTQDGDTYKTTFSIAVQLA